MEAAKDTNPSEHVENSESAYADRAFEYPYLPRYLHAITLFLDRFINRELSGPQLSHARLHVYGLWCGLILMPIYCVVYYLGNGDSIWFYALMLSVVPIRIVQLRQAKKVQNIHAEISKRINIFNAQIVLLSIFTGGLYSPAVPWLLSNVFQVGLTLSYRRGTKILVSICLLAVLIALIHPLTDTINLIPTHLISELMAVSSIFILLQVWIWSTLTQQYRLSFKQLYGALVRDKSTSGNLIWDNVRGTLKHFKPSQSSLKFVIFDLDVSQKTAVEKDFILHQNRMRLSECTNSIKTCKSVLAEISEHRLLWILHSDMPVEKNCKILKANWPIYSYKGCGLDISEWSDSTPKKIEKWILSVDYNEAI